MNAGSSGRPDPWPRAALRHYDNRSRDRDGREFGVTEAISRGHVSVDLHGRKLRGGYSLTRMRRGGRKAWLLVNKADKFTGGPVKTRPESVRSGKTIDQLENE